MNYKIKTTLFFVMLISMCMLNGCTIQNTTIDTLCEAIENGNTSEALELAEKINDFNISRANAPCLMDIVTQGTCNTESPLIVACKAGDLKVMEYLLKNGADTNFQPYGALYPLEAYCFYGCKKAGIEGLELLLDYGADVYAVNDEGKSVMDYASENKDNEICNYIVENYDI